MPDRLTVLETAALLRAEADARTGGRIRSLPEGGAEITCREGCHACCHQLVVVSPMEAAAIAAYLAERPELAAAVEERRRAWEERVAADPELAAGMEAFAAREGYVSGEEGGELELAYWRARLPCPFLDEGRCSVYPVRPFACREHHVLSDPVLCGEDPDAVTPANTRMEFRAVAGWVGSDCFGLPDRLLLLPRALDHTAAHPDEARREAPAEAVAAASERAQRRARQALALLQITARSRPG